MMTEVEMAAPAIPAAQGSFRQALAPNLFIIGASKAGSSALHAYLRPLPDIQMSREKEPCFFVDQDELEAAWPVMARQPCSHNWDAYLDLWEGGAGSKYRGEGSVYYSQAPHRSGVPARIKAVCPDARIVYTVREPVSRAIGHYWQRFKEFQEPMNLTRAVQENSLYRDTSDYALQLEAYLEHFDRDQIYIVVAEDLRNKRIDVLNGLADWLGLPRYDYTTDEIEEKHKSPPTSRRERFPFVSHLRNSDFWAWARKHLPTSVIAKVRSTATIRFDKAEVDETEARAYLANYLSMRRDAFEKILGYEVATWPRYTRLETTGEAERGF